MIPSKLNAGFALILITAERKRLIFESDIKQVDGKVVSLIKALEAGSDTDEYFSQSVQVGEVIQVAEDVSHIHAGDLVVMDYLADADKNKVAYQDEKGKYIVLPVNTEYYDTDLVAYATSRTKQDTYTWRAGDVKNMSWIYAVYRDGILIPNTNFILLEHKNLTWEGKTKSGITYFETEGHCVTRRVIGVPENCPVEIGQLVVVETEALYERSVDDKNFDIVMMHDLLAIMDTPVL